MLIPLLDCPNGFTRHPLSLEVTKMSRSDNKDECRLSFLGRSLSLSFKYSCTYTVFILSDVSFPSCITFLPLFRITINSSLRTAGIQPSEVV